MTVALAEATVAGVIVVVVVADVMESASASALFVAVDCDVVTIAVVDGVVATADGIESFWGLCCCTNANATSITA